MRAAAVVTLALIPATVAVFAQQPSSAPAGLHVGPPPEITPETREAIERGLRYLARTQNADGSWRTDGSTGGYPVAMTSLAGLALLAGGSTTTTGPYADHVSRALTYILSSARDDGLIARIEEEQHCMHGHGFAMLFLTQCYGMEESPRRQQQIRSVLRKAVALTARSQSTAGGWLYTPDADGDEGSVTVTQIQALRACRNAGIAVPKSVIDKAMRYLERSTNPDGGVRYQASGNGPSRPAITAAAVACYFNAGLYDAPAARRALEYARKHLPPGRAGRGWRGGHYFYAHLYLSQGCYLAGGEHWRTYYPAIRRDLLARQEAGSGAWEGDCVGKTYGTAVALLILQLPYKYLPIMQR